MKNTILKSIFFLLILFISTKKVYANTALDVYMNDFYSKSSEASLILEEIENTLKEGSRNKVCYRQREAARLGLLANKSLIKAFEVAEETPPMESINASQRRWESMLNEC
jgi:hypothetical protein